MARTSPAGHVDMTEAQRITGYNRQTIADAARAGEIPGAIQRLRKSPWYFTSTGLRKWLGIEDSDVA